MIHYHGTPIGGTRQDAARLLAGRHALVPFPRQDDMGIVAEACQSFVFDNGAFTVWKKGGQVDVEGYTRWVDDWHRHPGFDWALIPDVIDGDEAANDRLVEQWPGHLPGVPVWHMHESIERLQRLAQPGEWLPWAVPASGARQAPRRGGSGWAQRWMPSATTRAGPNAACTACACLTRRSSRACHWPLPTAPTLR